MLWYDIRYSICAPHTGSTLETVHHRVGDDTSCKHCAITGLISVFKLVVGLRYGRVTETNLTGEV